MWRRCAHGLLVDFDGAAALVLADADLLPDLRRAIAFRARQHVNDILPLSRRDPIAFERLARRVDFRPGWCWTT